MRCCRLCQRSQSITDSTVLKVGVAAEELNVDNAWRVCTAIRELWRYCRSIIDVFWLGIGKPIKHCYDFFKYVRSEVGTVVAYFIKKCCRKSKEKVKIAGKRALEEAVLKMRKLSVDMEHSDSGLSGDELTTENGTGLRHRRRKGSIMDGQHKRQEDEEKEPLYSAQSAVDGITYFKDQDI